MSWRAYRTLSTHPDFSVTPEHGIGEGGFTSVEFAAPTSWGSWHGDTSEAIGFSWRYDTAAEQGALRSFINYLGGRAQPFFLPSWEPDYQLAEDALLGATTIRVVSAGLSAITESRPDTRGRTIFLATTKGEFQSVGILNAIDEGATELLQLDAPLAQDCTVGETIVGQLRMVRLADDRTEWSNERPGRGSVGLRMMATRQTRHINEEAPVTSSAAFDVRAFKSVILADANPSKQVFTEELKFGPSAYAIVQSYNYFEPWRGRMDGTSFILQKDGATEEITSTLFDDALPSLHITFCFDAIARETIAWVPSSGGIRIGWRAGLTPSHLDIEGVSPLLFQTWVIHGGITAGEADVVLFYLRPGYSAIFARFQRESFATEHMILQSPHAPLYLQQIDTSTGELHIIGMDAGHRLATWRTDAYMVPRPPEMASVAVDELTGLYLFTTVYVAESDAGSVLFDPLTGAYAEIRISITAPPEPGGVVSIDGTITGAYTEIRIPVSAPAEPGGLVSIDNNVTGEYKLTAIMTGTTDTATVSIDPLTGSYA